MLALLLAGLLTAGALTACGSTENKPETNIPNAENGETVQETEPETEPDPFEGTDFGGKSLRINSSNDSYDSTNAHRLIAGSGEMNGEIVNDAVYKRNEDVQEFFKREAGDHAVGMDVLQREHADREDRACRRQPVRRGDKRYVLSREAGAEGILPLRQGHGDPRFREVLLVRRRDS